MASRPSRLVPVLCLALMGASASAAGPQMTVPITGGAPEQIGSFAGTFSVANFSNQDAQILAQGRVAGVLQTAAGPLRVANKVALSVTIGQASCKTLRLQFAPQDLSLIGQTVHLDQSVLDLTPQSGTANLLCAAADAVNDPGTLVNTLNSLHAAVTQ